MRYDHDYKRRICKRVDLMICHNCGNDQFRKRGIEHYASGDYQRWQCKKCGKHTIAGKIEEKQTI